MFKRFVRTPRTALDNHPVRDDLALRQVCKDTAMGRWEAARDLLEATGQNWDRRIFRLQVLARGAVSLQWAETWVDAERSSPDALAMLAHVQALRSIVVGPESGWELLEQAWETCHRPVPRPLRSSSGERPPRLARQCRCVITSTGG
jgi:hypothetical protein